MFTKSQLALVIGAVLAAPAVAEVQTTDEHLVVEGREFGYKADTNSTAMRMEMTQLERQLRDAKGSVEYAKIAKQVMNSCIASYHIGVFIRRLR